MSLEAAVHEWMDKAENHSYGDDENWVDD